MDEATTPAGEVAEIDGLLWKPKPGATASGEEFRRARSLILEIHRDASWNPWVKEDRAREYEQATAGFEQWTRAEPDFRPMTSDELEAQMAAWDAEFQAREAERDQQRAARVALYDERREQARLALLEQQAVLRHYAEELDGLREGRRFPAMPAQRRREQITELEQSVAAACKAVDGLQEELGDAETVVDARGWLPKDRRELALSLFSARRCVEVRELRERIKEQQARLKAAKVRAERAPIRDMLNRDTQRLESLMAIPRQEAAACAPSVPHRRVGMGTSLPSASLMPILAEVRVPLGRNGRNGSVGRERCSPPRSRTSLPSRHLRSPNRWPSSPPGCRSPKC